MCLSFPSLWDPTDGNRKNDKNPNFWIVTHSDTWTCDNLFQPKFWSTSWAVFSEAWWPICVIWNYGMKTQHNIVCFLVSDLSAWDTREPPPETQALGQNTQQKHCLLLVSDQSLGRIPMNHLHNLSLPTRVFLPSQPCFPDAWPYNDKRPGDGGT